MSSPVPPGERPGYPNSTGYTSQRAFTPVPSDSAGALAGSMQNLNINRPPPPPWGTQQTPRPGAAPQGMQNSGPPFVPAGSRPMGMGIPFPSTNPPHVPQSSPSPLGVMPSGSQAARPTGRPVVRPAGPPYGGAPPVSAPNSNMGRPVTTPFVQRPNAPPSRPPGAMPVQDGLGSPFAPGLNFNSSNQVNNGTSPFVQGAPPMRPPFSQGANAMHPPVGLPRSSGPTAASGAGTVPNAQRPLASAVPPPQFPSASHTPSPAPPTTFPAPGLAPSSAPPPPFAVASQRGPPSSSSLYGAQPWQPPSQQHNYPDSYVSIEHRIILTF